MLSRPESNRHFLGIDPAAETPEDEPPPFAALGLMLLLPTVWIVELVWTVALIRRCRSARPSA
jgi:hypothetical protein